ncbi:MAG: carbamoyl-phosphate synthase large subunit [Elusimicrobia bacterium]|nr:carbamoyl-phosphate synthase large subunit [Elusimicrobiota bacterium]
MPARRDIQKILIIGSGPIIVGQACEFDYSGTQAIKALRALDYEIVLVNSNPATIMTDPEVATRTYIEPLTTASLERVIIKEKPQALLATLGGQTALNLACDLEAQGVLRRHGVDMIGASAVAIKKAENRELFKATMEQAGIECPKSFCVSDLSRGLEVASHEIGFPLVLRASFTLGGLGSSIVYTKEELAHELERALELSPVRSVLIEEYLGHWKEFELELMRDHQGNQSVVAAIENVDPMGVHTGDSITVCPALTLTDVEYQKMRDLAFRAYEALGIACGGSNVQFAVNPHTGRIVMIEINPRVSRSSALASKATGFPIAKIAAMLAVGMTLDEITNDITGKTPASFEPTLDYVVVKTPRFHLEKFPGAQNVLNSQMKSIGEAMAIGKNFLEALQKGWRSLEENLSGLEDIQVRGEELAALLSQPNPLRLLAIYTAFLEGFPLGEINRLTGIDPWFLREIERAALLENGLRQNPKKWPEKLQSAIDCGFSTTQIASFIKKGPERVREEMLRRGLVGVFREVDTCAAEFEAQTPYFYSTVGKYQEEGSGGINDENLMTKRDKVIVLGSGPNRIGQGIEFDYVCVHAVEAIREEGLEAIMINSNPETVSTDYNIVDRLYFEPLGVDEVCRIARHESQGLRGLLLGFGGQTPLNISHQLERELGRQKLLGTPVASIDAAEDRRQFGRFLENHRILHPKWIVLKNRSEVKRLMKKIHRTFGFPVLVRPSYVLGGRGVKIFYDAAKLEEHLLALSRNAPGKQEIYIDQFLEDAVELDVDVAGDGKNFAICGIMEHIEEAGIHSGDSSCVWPPVTVKHETTRHIEKIALLIARGLKVCGLLNIQFALGQGHIYVIEANPRASRTVPFISKASGVPWAKIAAKACLGRSLVNLLKPYKQNLLKKPPYFAIKTPIFSWERFLGADILTGPEMRSTGEIMAFGPTFQEALLKAQEAANRPLPKPGEKILFSLKSEDKAKFTPLAKRFHRLGYKIVATKHTARYFRDHAGIDAWEVFKISEGRPHVADVISNRDVALVVNTPSHQAQAKADGYAIRRQALHEGIPLVSTPRSLEAVLQILERRLETAPQAWALQDLTTASTAGHSAVVPSRQQEKKEQAALEHA